MHMRMILSLTSLLLTFTFLLPIAEAAARPSFRAIQKSGQANIQSRVEAFQKPKPKKTTTYRNPLLGYEITYPEGWTTYLWAKDECKTFADDCISFISDDQTNVHLMAAVKDWKKPVQYADLEEDFRAFSKQPTNLFESDHMRFVWEFALLKTQPVTWQGVQAIEHTFKGKVQSVIKQFRQVRIPVGNRIFILEYRANPENFTQNLPYFDDFFDSFHPLSSKETSQLLKQDAGKATAKGLSAAKLKERAGNRRARTK